MDCASQRPSDTDRTIPCVHYLRVDTGQPGLCTLPSNFLCTEALKHYSPRLSHSAVIDWRRCRKRFYYRYVQGLQLHQEEHSVFIKQGRIWDEACDWNVDRNIWNVKKATFDILPNEFEQWRMWGLVAATRELDIQTPSGLSSQFEIVAQVPAGAISVPADSVMPVIKAKLDARGDGYFVENKLVSRPQEYLKPFNILSQVGTYFLLDDSLSECIMRVVQRPMQKPKKDESPEEFGNRVRGDILSKPSHYFIGWNKDTRLFGRRFHVTEFDLIELLHEYINMAFDMREAQRRDAYYRDFGACGRYAGECEYQPICETGGVSDELYARRDKNKYGGFE